MENDDLRMVLPTGSTLSLRPVVPDDDEFLLSVYASTRAEELAQVPWSDEQKKEFVRWQSSLQRQDYEAKFPHTQYDVILVDDQPAGRIWISRDDEQIRLLDIALLDEFQNRGVGTVLLRRLIDEAARAKKPLRHMVFILNTNARRFYERLGFVVIEELGAYLQMEWRKEGFTINADE
jgi:GNAT superfamily N-acetyltransferase